MGSFGPAMDLGSQPGFTRASEQPGKNQSTNNRQGSKAPQANGGAAVHVLQPGGFQFRADQQASGAQTTAFGATAGAAGTSAFAELDANQDPIQRMRFAAGSKDSSSMGDQAKQQAPAFGAAGFAPSGSAAPAANSWASFLSGMQQQSYVSPGARAGGRRAGQRRGATPRASRMQQRSSAAVGASSPAFGQPPPAPDAGSPAAPVFAFGSPMQQAEGAAATPAQASGSTSAMPPGTAMSTDTNLPAGFTAAFSAMSVDAATPSFGSSQSWDSRGPRAAAVTGKRLFETPSSAGGDGSTPSPFGSWGRPGAEQGSAQQEAGGTGSRPGPEPVPFPGFGGAMQQDGAGGNSPAGGNIAFQPGKPTPSRSRGRQHRGSPARKPPPAAPVFGGFGSPAFSRPAGSSAPQSDGTPSAGVAGGGAQAGSSSSTPAMASGASFQGFVAGHGPASAASTPGFSPMMWSPVEAQGSPANGNTSSQATPPRAPAAAASFEAVDGRQQSAAASDRLEQDQLQQAAQRLFEQQVNRAATAAAAAVDLPSDDSAVSIAELLTDLSASGSRAQPAPEAEAVAGLRAAVEQLSTAENPIEHQQQQASQPPAQPSTQQEQQAADQQPAAASGFVFGSPDNASSAAGAARLGGLWVSSPAAAAGVTPTTLFDMSPLKASLSDIKGAAGAAAGPMPQATAATAAAVTGAFAAPPAFVPGSAAGAAARGSAAAGNVAGGASGGFSFTPGKGSKPGGQTPGAARASVRGKKQTPSKARAQPAAGDSAAAGLFSAAGTAEPAAAATAASAADKLNGTFAAARPQQQQQQQQQAAPTFGAAFFSTGTQPQPSFQPQPQQPAGASGVPTPRRKLHATQRRPQPASQQQQQPAGGQQWQWPPATSAPGPNVSFTLGSSSRAAGGTPVKSPRKGRQQQAPQQPQPQPQMQPQAQPRMQQPVTDAQRARQFAAKCSEEAKASWQDKQYGAAAEKFSQAINHIGQLPEAVINGDDGLADTYSELYTNRSGAWIGMGQPVEAVEDALLSVKRRMRFVKGHLRLATCLTKLGCLIAADRALDKVLDMTSASSIFWRELNVKRQQVQQLMQKQQRVVAAALGCDAAAAAAGLAALSSGQPVAAQLQGYISMAAPAGLSTAAPTVLGDAGTSPLEDAAAVTVLLADVDALVKELDFWEDGAAFKAWLMLRAGQLDDATAVAEAPPNAYAVEVFRQQGISQQHDGGRHLGWRWWVLAQVKWQQGDLAAVQQLLQQGQKQLAGLGEPSSGASSSSNSVGLWRQLLPNRQELHELLQQTQQLLSLKEAGNAAIKAKQYDKAAEEYTKALALQPSCGFAAVIHSNRAAAYQQQHRLVEALADCSRAVALDPRYARAYLRMAQILEALHRADRAVVVLQDALKGSANAVNPATTRGHELTHGAAMLQLGSADRRKFEDMLATAQVAARRFKTPHHYKALNLTMTASEADIRKAYRALALKHHPDKALQHCRWSGKLGKTGAAAAHLTAACGGVEASLKAAANEVFGFLSAAHEELTSSTSRSKLDRDLRTEEQLWSNNSDSSYGGSRRPPSYTYSYGGRRAPEADYGYEEVFRRAASGSNSRPWQQQTGRQQGSRGSAGSSGSNRPGGSGGSHHNKWYDNYWAGDAEDLASDEDDDDEYGYTGGYRYQSKY